MMGVVNLLHEIHDGQLQLMRPQPVRLGARAQSETRTEIVQYERRLRDYSLARLQERRRVRRPVVPLHHRHHRRDAALARHVDIVRTGLFQREPDEFAAALDLRPVIQFVAHRPISTIPPRRSLAPQAGMQTGRLTWINADPARTLILIIY
jgi:hypothetical protein